MNATPRLWDELLRLGVQLGLQLLPDLEEQGPWPDLEQGPWPDSAVEPALEPALKPTLEPASQLNVYGPVRGPRCNRRWCPDPLTPARPADRPPAPSFESLCARLRQSTILGASTKRT